MTQTNRIQQRMTKNTIALIVFIFIGLFSLVTDAQVNNSASYSAEAQALRVKTSHNKNIRHAAEINLEAKAVVLQNEINSGFDDVKPRLTPCGSRLYFSRNFHPGNVNGVEDSEDIWFSDFNAETNAWSEPIHMAGVLNNAGPNYVNNVSVTGDTIILGNRYMKKGKMRAGLSYSVNVNGQWSVPTNIEIKNDYNVSDHANSFVSLKNGVIIRSIERAESIGGRDLFVSFWDGDKATEPLNMGTVINTEFEESSPFLAQDNTTMYFASKGHSGHGGFDIYVTRRLDETWTNWSAPENLGPAVNGPMDDEFFSVTNCGQFAIFSKQVNVHNTDLYRISMEELYGESTSDDNHNNINIKNNKNKHHGLKQDNSAFASL